MEAIQRVTRRMAHKLLSEKSLPNRLQRLANGGFKRKADFFTLSKNKRRKLAKLASQSTDTKSMEKAARLKKGKIGLSEYSVGNEEVQIFVELPADIAFSFNTLKMNAEDMEFGSHRRLADDKGGCNLMDATRLGIGSEMDGDLDCGVSGMDGFESSENLPYVFSLVFDTDSEDQSILDLGENLARRDEQVQKDDATSKPIQILDETDSPESDVVQVEILEREIEGAQVLDDMDPREIEDVQMLDKMNQVEVANSRLTDEMPESEITDAQACNGSNSLLEHVKEEFQTEGNCVGLNETPERGLTDAEACNGSDSLLGHVKEEPVAEGDCLRLNEHTGSLDGERTCKLEKPKGIRRSGPGSKWMYSGSRFAAFLRSAVGVIDLDADDQSLQNHVKAAAKQKSGAADGRCFAASSPPKRQPARFPGKRKVTLSPSSQLKLLEASKSSSYRRMLPFCAELAKDLATQSTLKVSPRADCTAPRECDVYEDKCLNAEPFIPEHIKIEENESELPFVICDKKLSSNSISKANVELGDNRSQIALPSNNKKMSTGPQCIEHVKVEQNEDQMELIPSDGQIRIKSSRIEHVDKNELQLDFTLSEEKMIMGPPCTGQVKPEQNDIEMELPSNGEDTSGNYPYAEHNNFKQSDCQVELVPGDEEFSREPLATEPNLIAAIDNGLSNTGLSIGNANLEQSGNQLDSVPDDQFLSRKSLFVEKGNQGQSGNQSKSATGDDSLSRGSFYTGCVKPEQTERKSKSVSIQLEPSPACHGPCDEFGKFLASHSSGESTFLFNGQCISPLPTLDSESINLVDHKTPSPSPCGSYDVTLFQTCSEVPSPLHTPASVPSKGILKCSHRSCKGMCLCSDCASFRLQAEKASEFSERQLRETETLAVALISELTNVRSMLDKYLIAKGKGTRILCSIPHSQLKDISRSTLRAEETARNHLVQMTRDCHLHCKILRMQQRKVKFADKVEVKTFKSE